MSKRKPNSKDKDSATGGKDYDKSSETKNQRSGGVSRSKETNTRSSGNGNSTSAGGAADGKETNKGDTGKEVAKSKRYGANDPEFYSENIQLLADTCSIPWNRPTGSSWKYYSSDYTYNISNHDYIVRNRDYRAAGLLSVILAPTIGQALTASDPVNLAANSVYSYIRTKVSGRKNYDPCDYILYMLAICELASFVQWMKKIYSAAQMYSDRNWYFGKCIVEANGVDVDDIVVNLANFRAFVNTFIEQIEPWAIPKQLWYTYRKHMLYEAVYTEGPSVKEQIYQFVPGGFYRFTLDANGAGCLDIDSTLFVNTNGTWKSGITFNDIATYAMNLISNLTGDEDFGIMSGDTRKAFDDNVWLYERLEIDRPLPISPDPYVLMQIKNADCIGHGWMTRAITEQGGTDLNLFEQAVVQDIHGNLTNRLALPPKDATLGYRDGFNYWNGTRDKIITVPGGVASPADVAEVTRLCFSTEEVDQSTLPRSHIYSGTELVLGYRINALSSWYGYGNWQVPTYTTIASITEATLPIGASDTDLCLAITTAISDFRYAPKLWITHSVFSNSTEDVINVHNLWQLDNYALFSSEDLIRMHMCCLLSLFHVPGSLNVM